MMPLTGTNEEAFQVEATLAPQTVYTAFGIGLAEEGTFEVKLVKDAGTGGGLRGDEPAPQTGGLSPAWVSPSRSSSPRPRPLSPGAS